MRIGELSARTGASVRMLRYYEQQGLLQPRRTTAGYRIYSQADVDRVARIRCMLSAALPSGIVGQALRFLVNDSTPIPDQPQARARLVQTLQDELDALADKIAALRHSQQLLATIVADIRDGAVGPDHPGDPGVTTRRKSVRKSGPSIGPATPRPAPPHPAAGPRLR